MFSLIFVAILSWKSRFSSWFCQFRSFFRRKAAFDFHIFHSPTVRILKIFLQIIRYMQDDIKKECALAHSRAERGRLRHISSSRECASTRSSLLLYRKCDAISYKVTKSNTNKTHPLCLFCIALISPAIHDSIWFHTCIQVYHGHLQKATAASVKYMQTHVKFQCAFRSSTSICIPASQ